jgi:hypothetical protein
MSGAIPPLLQYAFMAWCLVKAQGRHYLLPLGALYRAATVFRAAAMLFYSLQEICPYKSTYFSKTCQRTKHETTK